VTGLTPTLRELEEIVGAPHLLTATDARAQYALEGQTPLAVASPGSGEEAAALLRTASQAKLSVLLRGAGHHLYLGAPPGPIGLVVSVARLNQIVAYDAEDVTVTLQAGVTLEALQKIVGARRQMLPLDPPGPASATLGGIVSANLAGPMRMAYGSPRDLVLGLRVALTNGEVIKTGGRTVKNVAGYDLSKLFIGALGSVGAVVEITLRLAPLPQARAMVVTALPPAEACAGAAQLVSSRLEAATCEILNQAAAERLAPSAVSAGPDEQVLVIGLLGEQEAIRRQERDIRGLLGGNCAWLEGAEADALWRGLRSLAYPHNGAPLMRIGVPLSEIPTILAAIPARQGWQTTARAADGLVYASPSVWDDLEDTRRALTGLRSQAESVGGYAVLESGPVALKRALPVWGDIANADLMRALKQAYDPEGTLGCGRLLP